MFVQFRAISHIHNIASANCTAKGVRELVYCLLTAGPKSQIQYNEVKYILSSQVKIITADVQVAYTVEASAGMVLTQLTSIVIGYCYTRYYIILYLLIVL